MTLGEFLRDFIEEAANDGFHFLLFVTCFFAAVLQYFFQCFTSLRKKRNNRQITGCIVKYTPAANRSNL